MPSIWLPDAAPASAGSLDDEFRDASSGLPSGWAEVDHGSVQTVDEDELGLQLTQATHVGESTSGIYKALPAGNFTIWTKVSLIGLSETSTIRAGIFFWVDATVSTGDITLFVVRSDATDVEIQVATQTQYDSAFTNLKDDGTFQDILPTPLYLRVRRNGTTFFYEYSSDGIGWQLFHSNTPTAPAHVGVGINNTASGADMEGRFAFFRYVASDVGAGGRVSGDRIDVLTV